MRIVFLVGTDHRYQRGAALGVPDEVFVEFRAELQRLIQQHTIQGIAEEMSIDGMGLHHCSVGGPVDGSLSFCIARDLKIPHLYCDPSRQEQHDLGINSDRERECYWLERLRTFSGFPCLFVLGADHVFTFFSLLEQSGFRPMVLIDVWKPQCPVEV